jgi:hypothetical protein
MRPNSPTTTTTEVAVLSVHILVTALGEQDCYRVWVGRWTTQNTRHQNCTKKGNVLVTPANQLEAPSRVFEKREGHRYGYFFGRLIFLILGFDFFILYYFFFILLFVIP